MSEVKQIFNWNTYKLGEYEYRLVGLVSAAEGKVESIVSDPIVSVDPERGIVTTAEGTEYKPMNKIEPSGPEFMDRMYIIDRWCTLNDRSNPRDFTEMIVEMLEEGKVNDN